MDQLQIPAFGGVAGRVLKEAFSFQTWVTGFLLGATVFTFGFMLGMMGVEDSAFFLAHCLVPIIVSRYALNGYHGEWRGSVFSTRGGTWLEVGLVTWRYIALTLLWLIPLTLLGADPGSRMPSGVTILYMTAWVLSPPLFLIMAVGSPTFASIFFPQTWQSTFRNRVGDLISLYVVYTGIVTCLTLLSFPVLFALFSIHENLAIAGIVAIAPFTLGTALSVMGRLCGFFPVSASGPETAPELTEPEGPAPKSRSGKPVLSQAREQIDGLMAGFDEDPEYTVKALEELRDTHDPHPVLMHALCRAYAKSGRREDALNLARETVPFLLQHQNLKLSAELHDEYGGELDLDTPSWMQLGDYLATEGTAPQAAAAYSQVLHRESLNARAIKGVMKAAEEEHHAGRTEDAVELYRFLLDRSSESPLAEYVWEALERIEKKSA